jgi:hypothetical protein
LTFKGCRYWVVMGCSCRHPGRSWDAVVGCRPYSARRLPHDTANCASACKCVFLPKHLERAFYRHKRSAVKRDVRDKVRHPHTHKNRLRSSPRHKGVTLPVLPPEPTPSPPQRIRKMLSHPPSPPRKRKDQPKRKERKSSFPHTSDHL